MASETNAEVTVATEQSPWILVSDRKPPKGPLVKRWKNGAVWAGNFNGSDKELSFEAWLPLPP